MQMSSIIHKKYFLAFFVVLLLCFCLAVFCSTFALILLNRTGSIDVEFSLKNLNICQPHFCITSNCKLTNACECIDVLNICFSYTMLEPFFHTLQERGFSSGASLYIVCTSSLSVSYIYHLCKSLKTAIKMHFFLSCLPVFVFVNNKMCLGEVFRLVAYIWAVQEHNIIIVLL